MADGVGFSILSWFVTFIESFIYMFNKWKIFLIRKFKFIICSKHRINAFLNKVSGKKHTIAILILIILLNGNL